MPRLLLTFANLHRVLAAEKALKAGSGGQMTCRPTPTPSNLSQDICGMCIEILNSDRCEEALEILREVQIEPAGVHLTD